MDVFRAVPQVKKITLELIDRDKFNANDLTPGDELLEDFEIPIIRKAFLGYVKGPGTPVPVEIEVDRVFREYNENLPSPNDTSMSPDEILDRRRRANRLVSRDLLTVVLRHFDVEDANYVATQDADSILQSLGYLSMPIPVGDMELDDTGEALTQDISEIGPPILLTSVPSTQE